jgi:hypothetical protein
MIEYFVASATIETPASIVADATKYIWMIAFPALKDRAKFKRRYAANRDVRLGNSSTSYIFAIPSTLYIFAISATSYIFAIPATFYIFAIPANSYIINLPSSI